MDLLSLRAQLEALLGDVLGTYTLPNGITTPAIAARSAGEDLPAGTSATGLEVVVLRDPDLTPIPQYLDAGALATWTVLLVDWSGDADIGNVAANLINAFPGTQVATLPVPKGTGPYHQMRLEIRSNASSFIYTPPTSPLYLELPKSVTIPAPLAGDDFTLFRTDTETTLTAVVAVLQGSATPSVTFVLRYATDRTAIGTLATVSTTITSTTTGTNVAIQQMPIPSDSFVWLEITAVSGTVTELSVTLET